MTSPSSTATDFFLLISPPLVNIIPSQPLSDIYAVFEDHVARLVTENEALRVRNLALEAKELDRDDMSTHAVSHLSAPPTSQRR